MSDRLADHLPLPTSMADYLREEAKDTAAALNKAADRLDVLEAFVKACQVIGTGTVADPIRIEGPADGRWERVKP